eukprot:SAG31_NODE_1596_length_7800_cov_4.335801_7_plen_381_part_00
MPMVLDGVSNRSIWVAAGGYGLDTALTYGVQDQQNVGAAIRASGLPRSSFFIVSKVPCCTAKRFPFEPAVLCSSGPTGTRNTTADAESTLRAIGVDYVDLLLLHWPCDDFQKTVAAWQMMEPLVKSGKTRAIGVSNFNASALKALLRAATVKPAINQCGFSIGMHSNETGPQGPGSLWGRDDETVAACRAGGVNYSAYSPLGGWTGANVLENPVVQSVAASHNRSAAAVAMRWVVQQGISAVTAARKSEYAVEDIGIFNFVLSEAEMNVLSAIKSDCAAVVPSNPNRDGLKTDDATDFDRRHRPQYHLTPAFGHNNDPNGLFYDEVHEIYHVAVQWKSKVKSGGVGGWYFFTSRDLVKWKRIGVDPQHNVSSCSGGAVVR